MRKVYEILVLIRVENEEYPISLFLVNNRKLAEKILEYLKIEDRNTPIKYILNEIEVITSYRQFRKLYTVLENKDKTEVYTEMAKGLYKISEGGEE